MVAPAVETDVENAALRDPVPSGPNSPPVAVLALDVEVHGWIRDDSKPFGFWKGQFSKPTSRTHRELRSNVCLVV